MQPAEKPPVPASPDDKSKASPGAHAPAPVDLSEESVAGEEDPGASIEVGELARRPGPREGRP